MRLAHAGAGQRRRHRLCRHRSLPIRVVGGGSLRARLPRSQLPATERRPPRRRSPVRCRRTPALPSACC
jgi:hypothetical protein